MAKEKTQEAGCFRTMIGGQALIEGIMMMGPDSKSIVVRRQDGGLEVKTEERKMIKERYPILGWPLIRGAVALGSSLSTGVKALMYSAEFYPEDEDVEPSKFDRWVEEKLGSEKAAAVFTTLAVILGMAFSIGLFFVLPTLVVSGLDYFFKFGNLARNLVAGVIRVSVFMGYLILCSRMKDIQRVFSYHGAEHKTIFCYEKGLELTVENVRPQPKHHPRCGTSFLFVVIIVSVLVFSAVFSVFPPANVLVRLACQLLLLPLVVGISYEFNRLVGRCDNAITRFLTAPGMWMQNWTTFEPDDQMIEVAIEALRQVLPKEAGNDAW